MQNTNQSIKEQIAETEKSIKKLEKRSNIFSKLCPISGVLGVALNIAGICFAGMLTQAIMYTYLFCGLLAGGIAFLGFCIFSDIKAKRYDNKYEDAKVELHNLKNELYLINQNTHSFVNENKTKNTNVKQFTAQPTSYIQNEKNKKEERSI